MIQGAIETIAFGGQGVLRDNGYVIFVPFTAPGDQVTIELIHKKKNHGHGQLISIVKPSALRSFPLCPVFGKCGGCQFQHLNYAAQLEVKRTFIQDALKRIGKIEKNVPDICPADIVWGYRRHIRLNIKGNAVGYIATDRMSLIEIDQCPIFLSPDETSSHQILIQIKEFLKQFDETDFDGASLKVFKKTKQTFLLVLTCQRQLPKKAFDLAQRALDSFSEWDGIIFHSPSATHSFGNTECVIEVLGLSMSFSPFGFIQNHPEESQKLYQAILNKTPLHTNRVLDLFCGIGTTSLLFAQRGIEVIGIELHQETVELARQNALANGIQNVKFVSGKAEKLTKDILENFQPDCVLCNPPRTGLDLSLVQVLLKARPKHLMYVSCMPATLARDVKFFTEAGYHIETIQAFDMFPQTTHVETLIKLSLHPHQN